MFSLVYMAIAIITFTAGAIIVLKNRTTPTVKSKEVTHRKSLPKFTPIPGLPEDDREEIVNYLLKRRKLTLAEMQFIYDFLVDTGKEKWRYIEGYWGYYRVSSFGMVESCRYNRFLDPTETGGKYRVLVCVNGQYKGLSVHRIVAETFIPNPKGAVSVRPKDGNYLNCGVRNLEWKSRAISSNIEAKKEMRMAA